MSRVKRLMRRGWVVSWIFWGGKDWAARVETCVPAMVVGMLEQNCVRGDREDGGRGRGSARMRAKAWVRIMRSGRPGGSMAIENRLVRAEEEGWTQCLSVS